MPSLEAGKYSCARCSQTLEPISAGRTPHVPHGESRHPERTEYETASVRCPPSYDGWEIEQQLRHAFRVLRSVRSGKAPPDEPEETPANEPKFRIEAGHGVPAPHAKSAKPSRKRQPHRRPHRVQQTVAVKSQVKPPSRGDGFLAVLAWSTLSLGTMGFVCGLALLGWSASTGSQDLWTIGAPIILAGQIALVLGLVLQLDRIWRDSRRAAAKLQTVDEQIDDLKTATSLLSTTHGPSSAFYAHWAGGASPEILLGDLKSQLDLLAVKLAKE